MNQMTQPQLDRSPSTYRQDVMISSSTQAKVLTLLCTLEQTDLLSPSLPEHNLERRKSMRQVRTSGRRYVRRHMYLPRICNFSPHQSPGCQFEVAALVYDRRRLSAELRMAVVN
jgi:hypothetical protein